MIKRINPRASAERTNRGLMRRSARLLGLAILLLTIATTGCSRAEAETIQVYKTPTCGCCTKWIDHLREAGFEVEATDMPSLDSLKAMNGVSQEISSCHTALVEGYVLEGHVPASDVKKLLAERPKIAGLAVPGMPMGSPGMEHPDPDRHEAYDVLAFGVAGSADGKTVKVFSSHPAAN